jgi:hypothetical protein
MVANPGRRLTQCPGQMCERRRGSHEESQDRHPARVRKEFDLLKGMNRFNVLHSN